MIQHARYSLARAESRLTSLEQIDPKMDLGDGLTVFAMGKEMTQARARLEEVIRLDGLLGAARMELRNASARARDLASRILSAVASRYGRDSVQYKQIGGTPSSERKRPERRKKPAA